MILWFFLIIVKKNYNEVINEAYKSQVISSMTFAIICKVFKK